ncbi:MAG: hypothetical protein MJY92_01215 [Bacteroidales bacterium]|nr:hypothetical protein [Bacteroidales bacterium]
MSNKLQELTDRLYQEGLSKGREQAEQLLAEAKVKADDMVAKAQAQAEKIVAEAQAKAADIAAKSASDLKMASAQALDVTKSAIQNAVLCQSVDKTVAEALSNEEFVKETILAVAKAFSTEKSCDLNLILPESMKNLEAYAKQEVSKAIGKGVEVSVSKNLKGGFNVGPKDGGYYVSFSDETFNELIREYLRPATRKVLFGE